MTSSQQPFGSCLLFLLNSAQVCATCDQHFEIQLYFIEFFTYCSSDGKARRHREPNFGHLCTVGSLAAQKCFHARIAFCVSFSKIVDAFYRSTPQMKHRLLLYQSNVVSRQTKPYEDDTCWPSTLVNSFYPFYQLSVQLLPAMSHHCQAMPIQDTRSTRPK